MKRRSGDADALLRSAIRTGHLHVGNVREIFRLARGHARYHGYDRIDGLCVAYAFWATENGENGECLPAKN